MILGVGLGVIKTKLDQSSRELGSPKRALSHLELSDLMAPRVRDHTAPR